MSKRIKNIISVSAIAVACNFSACTKFVQIDASPLMVNAAEVFKSDAMATSAVMSIYNLGLTLSATNGGVSVYGGLLSDEIYPGGSNQNYEEFNKNKVSVTNSIVSLNFWQFMYTVIYRCNAVIEGIQQSPLVTEATRKQLIGEARFMRAFNYFHLVNLFGKVPLCLVTDYRQNATLPRTSVDSVYWQITEDLKEARNLLVPEYISANRGRPNRYTAAALLARVYLYTGQWELAEKTATEIIEAGIYSKEDDLAKVFLSTSNETIWQVVREVPYASEGAIFIPFNNTTVPALIVTPELLQRFSADDLRKTAWLGMIAKDGKDYYYPRKYRVRAATDRIEYPILFRLGEQYLIRAEARARQENFDDARDDLDVIRNRAGIGGSTAADLPALREDIERQRSLELFCEYGHRWFDLKRTGRANEVMETVKPTWTKEAALLPIPDAQRLINVFLDQNPGYDQ